MSKVTITDKASNNQQEYIAKFNGVVGGKEHEVIVYGFSFPKVRGNGATAEAQIKACKENFKMQVENSFDVEVTWE
jgi:hypothetical protein